MAAESRIHAFSAPVCRANDSNEQIIFRRLLTLNRNITRGKRWRSLREYFCESSSPAGSAKCITAARGLGELGSGRGPEGRAGRASASSRAVHGLREHRKDSIGDQREDSRNNVLQTSQSMVANGTYCYALLQGWASSHEGGMLWRG
jgi:hypothetical protein